MKRILIVIPGLDYAGTNRALLNLLGLLDRKKYQIDLFALSHEGILQNQLSNQGLLPENAILSAFFFDGGTAARNGIPGKIKRLAVKCYIRFCLHSERQKVFQAAAKTLQPRHYDAVVAFQEGLTTEFTSWIPADYRVAWCHSNYRMYLEEKSGVDESAIYSRFQRIVAVSEYTAQVFRECLPAAADRVTAIHNIMDQDHIRTCAEADLQDPGFIPAPFTLLSVGRFAPVKRFSEIPAIASQLRQAKVPFRWYLLGGDEGEEMDRVKTAIADNEIADQVILLGVRDNPYPYIQKASALVCTSVSEACPNVVNEAMILGVPVVSTDFPSATELITHGRNGLICPLEKMGQTLTELWEDRQLYQKLRDTLQDFYYDNREILRNVETVLDGATE